MRTNLAIAALFITLSLLTVSVHAIPTVGPNVDVTVSSDTAERQQVEPTIAVDPRSPNILVAGAQDLRLLAIGGHRWLGYYRSTDGGLTWSVSLVPGFPQDNSPQGLASPLKAFHATTDPVLTFDRNGNVYYVGISTSLTLFVVKYVNDGATYANATVFPHSIYNFADKPWIAVDTSGGPNDGNVYITYDQFVFHGPAGATLIRSTDGGRTWSLPQFVATASFLTGITVDPQGRVFVSSVHQNRGSTTGGIDLSTSTDGGETFNGHETVLNASLVPSPLPGNQFRDGTIPQMASDGSGVYIVWDDFTLGNSNVMFSKSTDGGVSWSTPVRVNDVLTGQHFFSSIAASGGVISVIWYDSRNGQLSNGTIIGLDVYYADSTNGGTSFSANARVTSVSFNPNIVERTDFGDTEIFMGDYVEVAASPGAAHAIWSDNRNACDNIVQPFGCVDQDAFTATITP